MNHIFANLDSSIFKRQIFPIIHTFFDQQEQNPQGIITKNRQNSQTSCRKTVSFEVLRPKLVTPRNSVSNEEFNKHLNGTNNVRKHNANNNNNSRKCDSKIYSVSNQCDINDSSNNCTITDKISINSNGGATKIKAVAEIIHAPNKMVWKNEISAIYEGKTA